MVKLIGLLSIVDLLEKHSDLSIRATAARLLANFCFNGKFRTFIEFFLNPFMVFYFSLSRKTFIEIFLLRCLTDIFCLEEYKRRVVALGALPHLLEFAKKGLVQINNNIPFSELKLGSMIGQGAFAKVYRGKYRDLDVAIKVFSESSVAFRIEDFYKEVAIMWYVCGIFLRKISATSFLGPFQFFFC